MLSTFPSVSASGIYGEADSPLIVEFQGAKIRTADPEAVTYVIIDRLIDRYAGDHGIEVQLAEIVAYVESLGGVLRSATENDTKSADKGSPENENRPR